MILSPTLALTLRPIFLRLQVALFRLRFRALRTNTASAHHKERPERVGEGTLGWAADGLFSDGMRAIPVD